MINLNDKVIRMKVPPYEIVQVTLLGEVECWYSYDSFASYNLPDTIYDRRVYEQFYGELEDPKSNT